MKTTRSSDTALPDLIVPDVAGLGVLDAALAYAKAGFYVLPCKRGSKNPGSIVGDGWQHRSSCDPVIIRSWWEDAPNAEIALHAGRSGLVVFDVDKPAKVPPVLADHLKFAPTQATRKREDGRGHYLFAQPPGRQIGNGRGKLGKGWGDVRGCNGVIIVAPSSHKHADQGGEYRWRRCGPEWPVPVLPAELAEQLTDSADPEATLSDADLTAFLDSYTRENQPGWVKGSVTQFKSLIADGESRHESMVEALCWAFREAIVGAYPARTALDRLRAAWESSFRPASSNGDGAGWRDRAPGKDELSGIASWAAAQALNADPDEILARMQQASDRDSSGQGGWEPAERFGRLGRILDRADLDTLPKPEPLIDGWLDLRTAVVMPGETGTNKTFAVLGWACSIATGVPWLGYDVRIDPCTVLLVVGEGAYGLGSRIAAWEAEHGIQVPRERLITLMQPDSINTAGFWSELEEAAVERGARFVAFDTFSSLAWDADETTEAAKVVRRMSELSVELDGTVVLVHHTGWGDKERSRGGSQFEANSDGVITLMKADSDPKLVCLKRKKVKDGPNGATLWIRRKLVGDSCVLEEVDPPNGRQGGVSGARSGAALSHSDLCTLVARWVTEHAPTTKQRVAAAVAAENRVGDKRVRAAFKSLERDHVIVSKKGKVRDGQGEKERDVWVSATARWSPFGGAGGGSGPDSEDPGPDPGRTSD